MNGRNLLRGYAGTAKEETFNRGIETALVLRAELMNQIIEFKHMLSKDEFYAIPFINVSSYHSKTIAYSLYHIFRIEDIVSNSLIKNIIKFFLRIITKAG